MTAAESGGARRPVRLLAFGISWPPETFLRRKLCGLADAGLEVTAAVRVKVESIEPLLPGVRVMHLGSLRPATFAAMSQAPRRTIRATIDAFRHGRGSVERRARRLRNVAPFLALQPDVVHFEWNSAAIDYAPFAHLWNAPIVVSCRGTQVFVLPHVRAGYDSLLRRSFEDASAVHCVCEAIRDEAVALGLDARKAVVIRPAVDTREFTPGSATRGSALHLAAVGALNWRKGYEYMLRILQRTLESGTPARLSIVGTGDEEPRIRYAIEELGLAGHVTLCGALSAPEVLALLRSADVFLHSSLGEGISNSVVEAMACGLPIVTTDAGGMREAVSDGREGYVVASRDVDAATRAIVRLAQDAPLRHAMGAQARATAESRFGIGDQIAAFKALYERLANVPRSA